MATTAESSDTIASTFSAVSTGKPMVPIQTHIYAFIRDEADNRMPIATRIEFCANNECLATFVSKTYDLTLFEQHGEFGSSFLIFAGQRMLQVIRRRFNYELQRPDGRADRFDVGNYDFCEMLRALYWDGVDWRCECITKELAYWLDQDRLFDPYLLGFIVSPISERRAY